MELLRRKSCRPDDRLDADLDATDATQGPRECRHRASHAESGGGTVTETGIREGETGTEAETENSD